MAYEKIRYDRILSSHRQGNGSKVQMFGGGSPANGDLAVYDANGNVVSGGLKVAKAGTLIGTRPRLNLIQGSNVTLTVADDAGSNEVDVTIASSGGSGGGTASLGTRADLPGSPGSSGEQYYCTDSPFHYIGGGSPLSWQAFFEAYPVTEPSSGDFAWVNQGTATATTTYGGIYIYAPATAGHQLRILKQSAPSTPYTLTARIQGTMYSPSLVGIGFRESSSGKLVTLDSGSRSDDVIAIRKWTDHATFSANYATASNVRVHGYVPPYLRISDDGTNRICSVGWDGRNFIQVHSVGRTDFLTADELFFFADTNGTGNDAYIWLYHWKVE